MSGPRFWHQFAQRCATSALVAAGHHADAINLLRHWLFRELSSAKANSFLSECYRHLGHANLADKGGEWARRATLLDLTAQPSFVAIASCAKIRDFARVFRGTHGYCIILKRRRKR